jgi:hypothetical protein
MGEVNSSITRVWPVFDCLFARDPLGTSWLGPLLGLASRTDRLRGYNGVGELLPSLADFGRKIPGNVAQHLSKQQLAALGNVRVAFENEFHPPPDVAGCGRELLAQALAEDSEFESAAATVRFGNDQSRIIQWWAFEGFTSVDCRLETERLIIFIEGKRTDLTRGKVASETKSARAKPRSRMGVCHPFRQGLLRAGVHGRTLRVDGRDFHGFASALHNPRARRDHEPFPRIRDLDSHLQKALPRIGASCRREYLHYRLCALSRSIQRPTRRAPFTRNLRLTRPVRKALRVNRRGRGLYIMGR